MSANSKAVTMCLPGPPSPVAVGSLWMDLSRTGQAQLQKIASAINQDAPSPGRLVYLQKTKLAMRLSGLQPVIFSAIDANTQMQVAQANFAMTSAAALSFIDFMAHSFPFPICEIRTSKERPFYVPNDHRPHRDFVTSVGEQGYLHSFVESHSSDPLFSITSKIVFKGSFAGLALPTSCNELQRALSQFLFFHNNFRFVPWLEGKTPIQKLRTFEGFNGIHFFNQSDECEGVPDPASMGSPGAKDLTACPQTYSHQIASEPLSRRRT